MNGNDKSGVIFATDDPVAVMVPGLFCRYFFVIRLIVGYWRQYQIEVNKESAFPK